MPKGYKTLSIKEEIYNRVYRFYGQKKRPLDFSPWLSELLLMIIEKDEFMKRYAPYLNVIGIEQNVMFIKDNKKSGVVEVSLKNNKLHCNLDGLDCEHIHYALLISDFGKILKVRG